MARVQRSVPCPAVCGDGGKGFYCATMAMARLSRRWLFQLWATAVQPPFLCNLSAVDVRDRVKSKYPSQPRAARGFSAWRLSPRRQTRDGRQGSRPNRQRDGADSARDQIWDRVAMLCCCARGNRRTRPGTDFGPWPLAKVLGTDDAELRLPSRSGEGSVSPRSRDSLTCPPISACMRLTLTQTR
jgi:hypothetical protein